MRIAHISDTHLGFVAYSRTTPEGVNQRQVDVQRSFNICLQSILDRDPDLVIHAGDLFHVVRPSNHTIDATHSALTAFQRARGNRPFVLIGGNHDTPRTSDMGNLLRHIARIPGVTLAAQMAQVIDLPEIDTEILAVPSNSLAAREEVVYRPTLGRKHSILTLHGMALQALPKAVEGSHSDFDVADIDSQLFTYTALGDYHVHSAYSERCCYSGSTDYTTTNIWEETRSPKGWVFFDTDREQLEHVAVATRRAIDLPIIDAAGLGVPELQDVMAAAVDFDDMPIVRQKVTNLHSADRARLSVSLIRELGSKCLNYQLVTTQPCKGEEGVMDEVRASQSIESLWEERAATASVPTTVTNTRLAEAGLALLAEVQG